MGINGLKAGENLSSYQEARHSDVNNKATKHSPLADQNITTLATLRARLPQNEIVYFVLPDRFENGDPSNDKGELEGGPLDTGFDPTHKGFYHGGDLKGLTQRLNYIKDMGITAVWLAPIFANKAVQGSKGEESAGYHGYWVTDFTKVDPHFGTNAEFKTFVDAAHAMGIKVYMDIITNHTADVINYLEGPDNKYLYRSRADYPETRALGLSGKPINTGFLGDDIQTDENFDRLTNPAYAYTPYVPKNENNVKKPAWLNKIQYYHNRGDTDFKGESSRYGDFVGLDDLFTEHPRVLRGMIDIYAHWIQEYGIDGYRIDTARHVNPEFWQSFVPAMLKTAQNNNIPNFYIFGEVFSESADNGYIAQYTRRDGFPYVLDFSFQVAMRDILGRNKGTSALSAMFDGDILYEGGEKSAIAMPTFLGNHDKGRFTTLLREDMPQISQSELLSRTLLAHSMMMTLRGSPVIYYGDEQGFVGDGNDQSAREDMFPSKTQSYNDNNLIGTNNSTAISNFDQNHPIYQHIKKMAKIRSNHPALSHGPQKIQGYSEKPGLFSVSRYDPITGAEYILAFNTSSEAISVNSVIGNNADQIEKIDGPCPSTVSAPGSISFTLPPFGHVICRTMEGEKR